MRINGKTVSRENLPKKVCPVCERPFTWRKRWSSCWPEVRYCSDRCRRNRSVKGQGDK
ncbi:MAG: DUF2256 domain-containing protein [Opitutales bacterium]